jgi:hypothetical protein
MSERTVPPAQLAAGETYVYTRTLDDYPASEWTLTLKLRALSKVDVLVITGVADGDDHVVTITSALSAALEADAYRGEEWVSQGADATLVKYLVNRFDLVVEPDLASDEAGDAHSHRLKKITLLRTELEYRYANHDIESYQAGGGDTAATRRPTKELEQELRKLEADEAAYQRGGAFQTVRMPIARRGRLA